MKKAKRILAVAGVVLLLSMYVVCFVLALVGKHEATVLFRAALGATVAVPIMLYAFMMLLKLFPMFRENDEEENQPATSDSPADNEGGGNV